MRSSSEASCSSSINTESSPASAKSTIVTKKVALLIRLSRLRRHIGQRGGEQCAAEAIADHIYLALAGRLFDRVERGERTLAHVIGKGLAGEMLVGVDPGNHKNRVALRRPPSE